MTNSSPSALRRFLRPTRAKVLGGITLAVVVLGLVWWFDGGRWMFFPRHFGTIEDGVLYRSGQIHERVIEGTLEDYDIEVIVDLSAGERKNEARTTEREVAKRLGVRLVELKTLDGSGRGDIEDYVAAITEMIKSHESKTPTLVHCSAGTQRTGAATAWYRMLVEGWSGPEAYAEYMDYRYNRPDSGRLRTYVNKNTERLVERLVETGAIKEAPSPLPTFGPE